VLPPTPSRRSSGGQGSIGYDDSDVSTYSHLPVARIRNPAGRYLRPDAPDITQALTRATVDEDPGSPDFLQENLNDVYTYANPLSYPRYLDPDGQTQADLPVVREQGLSADEARARELLAKYAKLPEGA
jgi:hypothetical protein